MKFSQIGREVFDELASQLKHEGFKARWSRRDFKRNEEWGRSGIHLYYYNYSDRLEISGELLVRIEEVHQIIDPFFSDREPKDVREKPTLSIDIPQHLHHSWKALALRDENDIRPSVNELSRIVNDVAVPFFAKYHKVEEAYGLLQSGTRANEAYSALVYRRGIELLAMAKLLERPEDIYAIGEEYRSRIVKADEERELPRFEALLASLI